jgi:ribose 5-phosphate isomerase A
VFEHAASCAPEPGRVPLTSFAEHRRIDVTIDGAGEVEVGSLNLIKGFGGALLREQIVASASKRMVVIVDEGKLIDRLGQHAPVPVEIVAFTSSQTSAAADIAPSRARSPACGSGTLTVDTVTRSRSRR